MTDVSSSFASWFREAKRRKVWVSIGAYLVIALTIIEFSEAIFDALLLPDWSSRLVTVLLILGFPVVVLFAWIFDVTREGIRRTDSVDGAEPSTPTAAPPVEAAPASRSSGAPSGAKVRRITLGTAGSAPVERPVPSESAPEDAEDPGDAAPAEPLDPERIKQAALGHVRHELKTPINAILGYSEMLLEDFRDEGGDTADRMVGDLEKIHTCGRRLLTEIDRILSPARIAQDAGSLDLDEASGQIRADLRTPVTSVVGYAELLIETASEEGLDQVVSDLERIRNAGKRLLELSSDIVRVAAAHMEEMGDGRLSQASEIAAGILAKARTGARAPVEEGMGSLLVVDDNAMNRDLLSRQLARAGYVVQTAEGGAEAVDLMARRRFDLVLLDVIMPGMDGLDVLRSVKSDERTAAVPVIMLSSLDDLESAIRCIDLGAEDFLSKPFHPTLLQARIGATLAARRMQTRMDAQAARLDETERFASRLLRSAFPGPIADRVRLGESEIVECYGDATVLWCDVDGAARSGGRDPASVAARIQHLLTTLEEVADDHGLEAVAPAGDGVVVAGGVPVPSEDHADRVAAAALGLRDALSRNGLDVPVRLGVDAGEVTGGVMGGERLGYRMWGEPVDLARALAGGAPSGHVMVSPGAYRLLKERWRFATPGVREVPGRGQMKTYVLEGSA